SAVEPACRSGSTRTSTPRAWPPRGGSSRSEPPMAASTARATPAWVGSWRSRACRASAASRSAERPQPSTRCARSLASSSAARPARIGAAGDAADEAIPATLARLAVAIVIDEAATQEVGDDFLHRDLDQLALARALPLDVGGHDGGGRVHAGAGVADGGAAPHGLAIREAGDAHDAARGLRDHVEALVLGIRTGQAEA